MTAQRAALAAAVAVALAVVFAAAAHGGRRPPVITEPTDLVRFIDREAGVVCWQDSFYRNSLACLPCADVAPGVCGGGGR